MLGYPKSQALTQAIWALYHSLWPSAEDCSEFILWLGTFFSAPQKWFTTYLHNKITILEHFSAFREDALNSLIIGLNTWIASFFFNLKRFKLRSPKACQYITPKGVRHLTTDFFDWEWRAKITVTYYNLFLNTGESSVDHQTDKIPAWG